MRQMQSFRVTERVQTFDVFSNVSVSVDAGWIMRPDLEYAAMSLSRYLHKLEEAPDTSKEGT